MPKNEMHALDHFTGNVPALAIFLGNVEELQNLVLNNADDDNPGPSPVAEVCLIGLVAYFEAFCKDHFASLINICPWLLINLRRQGQDVRVDAVSFLDLQDDPRHRLGFLLAESRNFRTAKEINAQYRELISITPFSKSEKVRFDRLLNDRNLLVHHGGIYTARYAEQTFTTRSANEGRAFLDSLVIETDQVLSAIEFLSSIATKLAQSTRTALEGLIEAQDIEQTVENNKALTYLTWRW